MADDPTALPSFADPSLAGAGEAPGLRSRVLEALIDEGLRPAIDDDGDVAVQVDGQALFVRSFDTRPPMMRVFGSWRLSDAGGDELTHLRAANAITATITLMKASVHGDLLVVAADVTVGDSLPLNGLLVATLDAVLGSVRTWYATVQQLLEDGG